MNKSKLFVFLVFSLLVGSSFGFIAPSVNMAKGAKATSRALITYPSNGDTVSGTVVITTSSPEATSYERKPRDKNSC